MLSGQIQWIANKISGKPSEINSGSKAGRLSLITVSDGARFSLSLYLLYC